MIKEFCDECGIEVTPATIRLGMNVRLRNGTDAYIVTERLVCMRAQIDKLTAP